MAPKMPAWETDVQNAIERFAKPSLKFPFEKKARLIDYLASRKVVPRDDLLDYVKKINTDFNSAQVKDFAITTLASATTAVHGKGNVPDPGGWYLWDESLKVYVMDRGFSAAWRKARS
jgi:hypothetical protein